MTNSVLDKFSRRVEQKVLSQEPLSGYTSFRIGGPAEYLYTPDGEEDLICALRAARSLKIPTDHSGQRHQRPGVRPGSRGVDGSAGRAVASAGSSEGIGAGPVGHGAGQSYRVLDEP